MIQILIVDDEKIERNGIKFLLKQLHMEAEIREAVNGVKALEALEEKLVLLVHKDLRVIKVNLVNKVLLVLLVKKENEVK